MTFTYGLMDDQTGVPIPFGLGLHMIMGWFKSTGLTEGGTIKTGLRNVKHFHVMCHLNAVVTNNVVNENVGDVSEPTLGGDIDIVVEAATQGRWIAIGN